MFGVSAANKQRTVSQMISRLQILARPEKKWLQQQRRICPKTDLRLLPITYTDFPRKGKCNPVATEFLSSSQHTPYCRLETSSSYEASSSPRIRKVWASLMRLLKQPPLPTRCKIPLLRPLKGTAQLEMLEMSCLGEWSLKRCSFLGLTLTPLRRTLKNKSQVLINTTRRTNKKIPLRRVFQFFFLKWQLL